MATKKLDKETRQLAILALRNAFYEDFSSLVNGYLNSAKGLDDDELMEEYLQEMANVYSRNEEADYQDLAPSIYVEKGENFFGGMATCGCTTLLESLESKEAQTVVVQGTTIFIRSGELRNGEWYYVEQ